MSELRAFNHNTIGHQEPKVEPNFAGLDSAADIVRDAIRWGLLDELRTILVGQNESATDVLRVARDIAYELAGAKDRNRAVDVFLHATGIAEFEAVTLREYAARHGVSHEWFRQEVVAMRARLNLPAPGRETHFDDAA